MCSSICFFFVVLFFFQAEDGIRDLVRSRGLGDVYKRQAMYRAITLYFLRKNTDWSDEKEVTEALNEIHLHFEYNPKSEQSEIFLNEENVEYLIRDLVVAEKVSEVATIASVRSLAVAQQQRMGRHKGIVMDGRDIGTTVFPHAELKIFMTADLDVRVDRRFLEMQAKNPNVTIDEVRNNLQTRDHIDSTRKVSPLKQADDAEVIDNTHLTQEEQLDIALKLVAQRL